MKDYKHLYQRFLSARPGELHFAAHSHHFWPDVTREAQLEAWDDAARFNDKKWDHIFSKIVPSVQGHIAKILGLKRPDMIALAPNTHDLVVRLFSELLLKPKLRLLTTDSEFHSFARQLKRFEEAYSHLHVTRISCETLLTDRAQFLESILKEIENHDVLFLSQVFFNSGLSLSQEDLETIVQKARPETVIIIDGYHGFGALPLDLSSLEGRIFYLAGGYKYAQGGEGVGFLVVPEGNWRPVITGWFAEFAELSSPASGGVGYAKNGMSFWGATMDPTGWYRFKSTWDLFEELGLCVQQIHAHVRELQRSFLSAHIPTLNTLRPLYTQPLLYHGHFLTYEAQSTELAEAFRERIMSKGIYVDQRGSRLRFGFGLYQDKTDIEELVARLNLLN